MTETGHQEYQMETGRSYKLAEINMLEFLSSSGNACGINNRTADYFSTDEDRTRKGVIVAILTDGGDQDIR